MDKDRRGIIHRLRKWLIANYLPPMATVALRDEMRALRQRVDKSEAELQAVRQEKEQLKSYIGGMKKALHMTNKIKGGLSRNFDTTDEQQ